MSLSTLQAVSTHIAAISGINDWYEYYFAAINDGTPPTEAIANKFFRYTEADTGGNTPFFMFRISGSGSSDVLLQRTQVQIMLCEMPTKVVDGDAMMADIIRLFRTDATQYGVVRFDPVGGVVGPMYMHNGRPVWTLDVMVYTEDK